MLENSLQREGKESSKGKQYLIIKSFKDHFKMNVYKCTGNGPWFLWWQCVFSEDRHNQATNVSKVISKCLKFSKENQSSLYTKPWHTITLCNLASQTGQFIIIPSLKSHHLTSHKYLSPVFNKGRQWHDNAFTGIWIQLASGGGLMLV